MIKGKADALVSQSPFIAFCQDLGTGRHVGLSASTCEDF